MSISCQEICNFIETIAPLQYAMEGDPVGLQLGDPQQLIDKVYVALELDDYTLQEAIDFGANMVIVHHTPFFRPFKQLREDKKQNQRILQMIRHHMALYTAHTNWDITEGGVNTTLAAIMGIENIQALQPLSLNQPKIGLGCIGDLTKPQALEAFAVHVAECLKTENLLFCGDPNTIIRKVACCGGSGMSLVQEAVIQGAEVFVTGDIKHHEALDALDLGLCLIDGGHYATERPSMSVLCAHLKCKFSNVEFQEQHCSTDPFRRPPFY